MSCKNFCLSLWGRRMGTALLFGIALNFIVLAVSGFAYDEVKLTAGDGSVGDLFGWSVSIGFSPENSKSGSYWIRE